MGPARHQTAGTFGGSTLGRRFRRHGGRGHRHSGGRGRSMKRWKLGLVGLTLAAAATTGCKQRLYISEKDYQHHKDIGIPLGAPATLDTDPTATIVPGQYDIPEPPTVDRPDRKIEEVT